MVHFRAGGPPSPRRSEACPVSALAAVLGSSLEHQPVGRRSFVATEAHIMCHRRLSSRMLNWTAGSKELTIAPGGARHSGKPPLESNATSSLTLTPAKIHSNKKNQYPRFLRKIYAAKNFGAWWGQTEFQVNLKLGLTRFPPHALTDSRRTRSGGRAAAAATAGT